MLNELQPVWKQMEETWDALLAFLGEVPDDRLDWRPAPNASTASEVAQHIARANLTYAGLMLTGQRPERFEIQPGLPRTGIQERLRASYDRVRETFELLPLDRLHARCADLWDPFGLPVEGPLDALWFAHQIVRHTAYHVGQIAYISRILE